MSGRTYVTETMEDGEKTYRSYSTFTPTYGFTGYRTYIGSKTAYNRFAIIAAYDNEQFKNGENEIQLWKSTVSSCGSSDDLRRFFPVLIAASVPYLATDTGHKVYVRLSENDDVVKMVRGEPLEKN